MTKFFLRSAVVLFAWCLFHLQGVVAAEPMPLNGPRDAAVKFVPAPPHWDRFLILVWQYQTDVRRDLDLYRQAGFAGFHIDYGAGQEAVVEFAVQKRLPYYVDHAAGKGLLHLTNRTGLDRLPSDGSLAERPQSLVTSATWDQLVSQLQANLTVTRQGPALAAAFDDEVSLGAFTSPLEVDTSPESIAMYRRWLRDQYGTIEKLNASWKTNLPSFAQVRPIPFEGVRNQNNQAPFARWNLAPWMDWRSYMDWQFADVCARLTHVANQLAPDIPAGFVGGQQPAPYGGYDYDRLRNSLQWIEAYDIGGTNEILRSFWSYPQQKPRVQTFFSSGEARQDAWFLWYYLLHGNRAAIAWPERDGKSWFADGKLATFVEQNQETFRELQGDVSRTLLADGVRCDPDAIAVLYSHPSIQASWVTDVVTHGKTWPRRSSSLDNTCQSAGKNRVAWFKLLEDCGYQYDVVSGREVVDGVLQERGTRVLILNRAMALSDAECRAIETFVRGGGTVIADHWTALLDEHGVGRPVGGLDHLFGVHRDESLGYFDGSTITEIDGEKYNRPFLERFPTTNVLRDQGRLVVERGTKADGVRATSTVPHADVILQRSVGRGTTVYLNLSPTEYFDNVVRTNQLGDKWRSLLGELLSNAGLTPRALVHSGDERVPLVETLYWRDNDRRLLAIVRNPSRQASVDSAGDSNPLSGDAVEIEVRLSQSWAQIRNLRTGQVLPAGNTIHAAWKPWEGLLFELR